MTINPVSPAVKVWKLNHWTTREVQELVQIRWSIVVSSPVSVIYKEKRWGGAGTREGKFNALGCMISIIFTLRNKEFKN